MKKTFLVALVSVIAFTACLKNGNENTCVPKDITVTAPGNEVIALKGYLTGNGITAAEDSRGFFYNISSPGTGNKPNNCSSVTVDYVAKLTNGTTVDSANNVTYPVAAFITGWQEALPLIASGGSMTVYLPPSLAYGSTPVGNVPANSNMIFMITLKNVFN